MKLKPTCISIFVFIIMWTTVAWSITNPDQEASSLIEEATRNYQNKEYEKAVDSLQKAIHIDGNNATAYAKLGAAYITLSKHKEAIPYLQKAIEIKASNLNDSSRSFTYFNLVNAYLHLEDIKQAKEWGRKAAQSNHNNVIAYDLIAAHCSSKGDYQEGIFYLEEGIKLNPNSISTLILLGTMYIEKGIKDKNESDFERGRTHTLKAIALLKEKGWDEKDWKRLEQKLKDLDEYERKLQK